MDGPLDTLLDAPTVGDLAAVLRESLTNVARHARASAVSVDVVTDHRGCTVTVADDGQGLGGAGQNRGLANLAQRAEQRGGTLHVESPEKGVRLTWSIPLPL
jgi:signal transduction histidine kinase